MGTLGLSPSAVLIISELVEKSKRIFSRKTTADLDHGSLEKFLLMTS